MAEKHNCYNAETIGDAYITVSGGPEGNDATTGAANIAAFSLDAVNAVKELKFHQGKQIQIRVGVASGPVVAGVIGTANVPKFTLFGETTSRAEEMEKTSVPLQVQCSEETAELLQSNSRSNNFRCKRRKRKDSDEEENTWWIVPTLEEGRRTDSDEIDDILTNFPSGISTVNSTSLRSEPRQSMAGMGSEENENYTSKAAGKEANYAQRSSTSASGQAEARSERRDTFEFENYAMSK